MYSTMEMIYVTWIIAADTRHDVITSRWLEEWMSDDMSNRVIMVINLLYFTLSTCRYLSSLVVREVIKRDVFVWGISLMSLHTECSF